VTLLVQSASGVSGFWAWAGVGVLASAILIPAGFFLSVLGRDPQHPGPLFGMLWAGVALLALSLAAVGISTIAAGVAALG
jgi:hypothetical protein